MNSDLLYFALGAVFLGPALGRLAIEPLTAFSDWRQRRYWDKHPERLEALSDALKAIYAGSPNDR